MKILHLIESGGLYGAERVLLDLAKAQTRNDDQPTIASVGPPICQDKPVEVAAREMGLEVHPFRMKAGFNVTGMRKLLDHAKQNGVDVLHSHGYRFDTLLAFADPFRKFPRVSTVHGVTLTREGKLRLAQRLGLFFIRRMHRAVFVSRKLLESHGGSLSNATCVANGIDLSEIVAQRDKPIRDSEGGIELLAIGRLEHEKNYALLLDVIHDLKQQNVPCKLTHYGEGRLKTELEQQVKRLGLSNVTFAGYSHEILAKLHASDALVFTSRTEGMPIAVIEAMLLGLPIVATAVGGIPEMLEGYPLGRLTANHSARAVASLITEVCSPGERRRVDSDTLAKLDAHYGARRMASEYRAIYEQAIENA